MTRLILHGSDEQVLPLLERLRLEGSAEIVALWPHGECPGLELYSEISGIALLDDPGARDWSRRADRIVSFEGRALSGLEALDPEEALRRFAGGDGPLEAEEPGAAGSGRDYSFPAFALELRREIQRSLRYHLGFCLTLFRIQDGQGRPLSAAALRREELGRLIVGLGRVSDRWGLSPEGVLLHLAPEIQEQSRLLKRRLSAALEEASRDFEGGPWHVSSAQALFPQDGERASELILQAQRRLQNAEARR